MSQGFFATLKFVWIQIFTPGNGKGRGEGRLGMPPHSCLAGQLGVCICVQVMSSSGESNESIDQNNGSVIFQNAGIHKFIFYCRYFLVDFYAPTTTVESMMEHLSRDIDVIRPNIVKHPLTQEVKECEGMVPVPLEEKLYSSKKRK